MTRSTNETINKPKLFTAKTAFAVIVANMIGTGVFTSLGFQLLDIKSGFVILMLWVVGGLTALCGALSYAELGAMYPRSGGEYNFLSRIYHPLAGFVSGWISATIGFAAPTALAAITFGAYLSSVFTNLNPTYLAIGLIALLTIVHASSRNNSSSLQQIFTLLKLLFIVFFCILAFLMVNEPQPIDFSPQAGDRQLLLSGAFAVSLIYVNYAFSGWNAATYLSSELEQPQKNLPKILAFGTLCVMVCYVALNFIFLYVAPITALEGKIEIGYVAASYVFGETGRAIMGIALALLLISTVSAMIIAGPRVLHVIGQDFKAFDFLSKTNKNDVPSRAIFFQAGLSLIFILTGTFESILVFAGFTLGLNTFLAVLGVFVQRIREPNTHRPYKTWGYPLTPSVFLLLTGWTLCYLLIDKTTESLLGLSVIAIGVVFYYLSLAFTKRNTR